MTDAALIHAFETCSLDSAQFSHRTHLRVAWLHLTSGIPFEDATREFCRGLRRYAASLGKADLYHETITWGFLALVNERQRTCGATTFDDFARQHPDLFEPQLAPLLCFYDKETLHSDLARSTFVLPRGAPGLVRVG